MNDLRIPVILLISRDPQLAYLIQRYTGNYGCQFLQTEYRGNVTITIAQNQPDIILLDISRANAEGRSLLSELKSRPATRSIPIILCATSETDWIDCESEGRLLQPILLGDFVTTLMETGIQIPRNAKEA
jgi:CheY-like chemotaxis protein